MSWMLLVMMILVACGSDPASDVAEDRQFANDPAPTRDETAVPTDEPTQAPVNQPRRTEMATPEALLRTRGAPSTLYTVSGGDLLVLSVDGDAIDERRIDLPDHVEVLGFDASPTGDRVGVLMVTADGGAPFVQFFRADGSPLGESATISPAGTPTASPIASPNVGGVTPEAVQNELPTSITWIPQGNGVLVVHDNAVVSVDIGFGASAVDMTGVEGSVQYAAVSPKGDRILVQVSQDDDTQTAYLIERESGDVHELRALRTAPGAGINELVWLPSGNGVLFVKGEVEDGVVMGGELFSYLFRNEVPRLITTSGQGGPSATITHIAVTPDGYSVAYDISIRDVNTWSAHSLWVRSLREDVPGIRVPVDAGQPITGIAWSSEGLLWAQEPRSEDSGLLLGILDRSGEAGTLPLDGTPVASPAGNPATSVSPVASPISSPPATPVPNATPVG